MPFDYSSMLIALGFAAACLAAMLFVAWFSARSERFLLTWSVGMAFVVVHVAVYGFYSTTPRPGIEAVGFACLIVGLALLLVAAKQVRKRKLSPGFIIALFAGSLIVALAGFFTSMNGIGFMTTNVVAAVLLIATAAQYAKVRDEAPGAAMGLMLLYGVTGISFFLCAAVLAVEGAWVIDRAPENWAEKLNIAVAIACLPGVGALSLALNQARLARTHRRDAETDMLTGLLNRRALFERYSDRRLDPLTSVVVFDLDHFKSVNDSFGHAVGDEVLRRFAEALRTSVRGVDTVARLGGEEFAVVLPRSRAESAMQVAERVRQAFADEFVETVDGAIRSTVSAGVATADGTDEMFADVLRRADQALYAAKHNGRDRVIAEPLRLVG